MARRILFFFGPPGSGKGTQAEIISKQLGLPTISTGDLLRRQSQLDSQAQATMNQGQLISDEIINNLLNQRLAQADAQSGFILDGYPRAKTQFDYFYQTIVQPEDRLCALEIKVNAAEVQKRLSGRRFCPQCGAGYHLIYKPSEQLGICDNCQLALEQRADDQPAVIQERLILYQTAMSPLIELWQKQNELVVINGEQDIAAVHQDIVAILQDRGLLELKP
jgi:adenylate kinase